LRLQLFRKTPELGLRFAESLLYLASTAVNCKRNPRLGDSGARKRQMVNHPNRKTKTETSPDYLARLRASKAEYEAEQETRRAAEEVDLERKAEEAREAGRQWARETATYAELCDFVRQRPSPFDQSGPERGHSFRDFQSGAKEIFDEIA
jgi:hypothetical protein